MNIVVTFPALLDDPDSGAPATVLELVRQYEARGHRVRLLSLGDMPRWMPLRARVALFSLFLAWRCRQLMRRETVDLVDGNCGDLWAFARAMPGSRLPALVYRSHGCVLIYYEERVKEAELGHLKISWRDRLYYGRVKTAEMRAALAASDAAIFLSSKEAEHATRTLGADPERSHVVALGLAPIYIGRPIAPTPSATALRIALIGHHIPRKGVLYAAQALNRLLADYPNLGVSYLGTGVPRETVLADLDPRWHGRITVVPRYGNAALPGLLDGHQIMLFPTLAEGFGKVLIEAMACGLAPVAADAEGVLDILTDQVTGLIVPRRDAAGLEHAVRTLVDDRLLLDRLRHAAHAHAQGFTWARCAEARLAIYDEALRRRRRRVAGLAPVSRAGAGMDQPRPTQVRALARIKKP
jgi:glycosyltransferase involved in cell wall biosynthesis